ncbi:hypothetical protein AVEN_210147-1, partial [Araneus ventricosus]
MCPDALWGEISR